MSANHAPLLVRLMFDGILSEVSGCSRALSRVQGAAFFDSFVVCNGSKSVSEPHAWLQCRSA
jgi:hypothetical protein